jgi:hypothetical protein
MWLYPNKKLLHIKGNNTVKTGYNVGEILCQLFMRHGNNIQRILIRNSKY